MLPSRTAAHRRDGSYCIRTRARRRAQAHTHGRHLGAMGTVATVRDGMQR